MIEDGECVGWREGEWRVCGEEGGKMESVGGEGRITVT